MGDGWRPNLFRNMVLVDDLGHSIDVGTDDISSLWNTYHFWLNWRSLPSLGYWAWIIFNFTKNKQAEILLYYVAMMMMMMIMMTELLSLSHALLLGQIYFSHLRIVGLSLSLDNAKTMRTHRRQEWKTSVLNRLLWLLEYFFSTYSRENISADFTDMGMTPQSALWTSLGNEGWGQMPLLANYKPRDITQCILNLEENPIRSDLARPRHTTCTFFFQ